ncbi:Gfo/Idh/MocA family oxidoreductase [Vibrio gigantis]|uniref:Gfo/Idh/MocA family protein n=1 Tax=Vibrio gigantis TaxID=296199 RepID=UPI003D115B1C
MKTVAVIGLGNIATRHRRNLKLLFPQCRLLAMSASGRVPADPVSDCDQVVSDVDEIIRSSAELVIVASPAPCHAEHTIPLLEAGIPTLIEKPVTTCVEEAKCLEAIVEKTQTPVTVGYCLRYLPSSLEVKALLDKGSIGELYNAYIEIGQYLPDWRPSKDYRSSVSANAELGGGALLELSHELDYAQWLLGDLTLQHAYLRSSDELSLEVEDLADIVTTTKSGALVNIHLDFLQRQAYRRCRFVGSKGTVEWDLIKNEVKQTNHTGESTVYSDPAWDKNKMYLNMLQDFINMTKDNKHSCIDLQQAGQTVELIETIKQYAKTQTKG